MSLKDGAIYQIRYIPANIRLPFEGGSYATGEGIGAPIRGEALQGAESWKVVKVQGKEDTYIIREPGFRSSPAQIVQGPGPVLAGWGAGKSPFSFARQEFVTLSVDEAEWVIQAGDGANGGTTDVVSSIVLPNPPGFVGVDVCVDLDSHTRALYLKAIPVIRDMPPAPLWQFVLVDSQV